MLGELIYEEKGKSTGMRVLSSENGVTQVEVSAQRAALFACERLQPAEVVLYGFDAIWGDGDPTSVFWNRNQGIQHAWRVERKLHDVIAEEYGITLEAA